MKRTKNIIILLLLLVFAFPVFSINFPKLRGRVNDYANILDKEQEMTLDYLLKDIESKTTSQFVILTIPSLEGRIPSWRATSASGITDMPTESAPRICNMRISAGVSKLGPLTAA